MTTKTQTKQGAKDYDSLHSTSMGFSEEEARILNPDPKSQTKTTALDWVFGWAMYSVPPLLIAYDAQLGFFGLLVLGCLICMVGTWWGEKFQDSVSWIREFPHVMGAFTLVSAAMSLVLPLNLLVTVAFLIAPLGAYRLYEQATKR